jgi:gas vesicle protein
MSGINKFIAGVVLGAAAGAAITVFLQTEKGKKVMSDVKDAAANAGEKIKSKLKEFDEEISELFRKENDTSTSV